ncbi:MAG: Gfo/Idh/MocA family oxidoreductase [Anaerolineae bacterium]|nr:Gfo/Idh/MocA family oxidoreductase [Anaerolineae bacterium]
MSNGTTEPLRVGVIGLGIGNAHAEGYARETRVKLAALCDSNEVRLKERALKFNVADDILFTDYRAMLKQAGLDIVSVCLPNALHAPAAIAALEAGCHVLCEKPLATSTAEAQDMIRAARMNGRRLMVAYNHRYRADVAWMKRVINEGRLGTIYRVDAWWRRETGIPGWGVFGLQEYSGGGALLDLGVHALDLALYLLGFPAALTVSGSARTSFGARGQKVWGAKPEKFDVDDFSEGDIRLEGGVSLHLVASWAEHRPPNDDLIRLEIQGTDGTVVLNIPNYTKTDTLRFYTEVAGAPATITPAVRWASSGHEALIADCVTSLLANTPAPTDAVQGLAGVRILEAIYRSAAAGREVVFEHEADQLA